MYCWNVVNDGKLNCRDWGSENGNVGLQLDIVNSALMSIKINLLTRCRDTRDDIFLSVYLCMTSMKISSAAMISLFYDVDDDLHGICLNWPQFLCRYLLYFLFCSLLCYFQNFSTLWTCNAAACNSFNCKKSYCVS